MIWICRNGVTVMGTQSKLPTRSEAQSQQDKKFEERLRIAQRIAKAMREAGYSCELGEETPARPLKPSN
jgi:hypothetical protein